MAGTNLGALALTVLLTFHLVACSSGGGNGIPVPDAGESADIVGTPGVCGTCAYTYVNGGIACGPGSSADAFDALSACACAGPCASACNTLCTNLPADQMCGQCLMQSCAEQVSRCAEN
jgi:hypothetical protein